MRPSPSDDLEASGLDLEPGTIAPDDRTGPHLRVDADELEPITAPTPRRPADHPSTGASLEARPHPRLDASDLLTPIGRPHPGLLSGALAGPLLLLAIFSLELIAGLRLSMMGVHDEELQRTLFGRFGTFLLRHQLTVLAAYLTVGAAIGLGASLSLSAWDVARRRGTGRLRRWAEVAAIVLLVLGWRIAITVVRYPQLYAEQLYAHGGVRRAIQVLLTDHVPLGLLVAAGWGAIGLFLVGPALTRRGRRGISSALRRARAGLGRRRNQLVLAGTSAVAAAAILFLLHRSNPAVAAPDAPPSPPAGAAIAPPPQGETAVAPRPSGTPDVAPRLGPHRPNILLLAVDSLRADRIGAAASVITPRLSELASRGVHFQSAYVSVPRTFPSWATLLSGRFAPRHGLRHMFPTPAMRAAVRPLLPARFAAAGWRTAVVSDFSGEIFSRLDAGFEERAVPYFDMKVVLAQAGWNMHPLLFPFVAGDLGHRLFPELASAPENADPERLADRVIETVSRLGRTGSPFFVTAFFSTAHFPYAAPDPWYRRFTRDGYAGPFRYYKPVAAFGKSDADLGEEDIDQVRGLYDGAVASVDAAIGRVLDALAAAGHDDDTIVVLLADHGENLFEAGRGMGHGEHLRGDGALHIPLVVYDPVHRFPAHTVRGVVRDVDLAPTLASLAGIALDPPIDGADLAPLLRAERDSLGLTAFAESELWLTAETPGLGAAERLPYPALPDLVTVAPDDDIVINPSYHDVTLVARHRALRTERWKLLYVPTRDGVRFELYDLKADPKERVDVAVQHPEVVEALRNRLYFEYMALDGSTVEAGFVVPRR